jgi:hypothetical protein
VVGGGIVVAARRPGYGYQARYGPDAARLFRRSSQEIPRPAEASRASRMYQGVPSRPSRRLDQGEHEACQDDRDDHGHAQPGIGRKQVGQETITGARQARAVTPGHRDDEQRRLPRGGHRSVTQPFVLSLGAR